MMYMTRDGSMVECGSHRDKVSNLGHVSPNWSSCWVTVASRHFHDGALSDGIGCESYQQMSESGFGSVLRCFPNNFSLSNERITRVTFVRDRIIVCLPRGEIPFAICPHPKKKYNLFLSFPSKSVIIRHLIRIIIGLKF